MSVLILISDYVSYREVCISSCYHAFSASRVKELIDACMRRLDVHPKNAELYISEASDTWLASLAAARGIALERTAPPAGQDDMPEMYEGRTHLDFGQLQEFLRRYGTVAYTFERQNALQA